MQLLLIRIINMEQANIHYHSTNSDKRVRIMLRTKQFKQFTEFGMKFYFSMQELVGLHFTRPPKCFIFLNASPLLLLPSILQAILSIQLFATGLPLK